MQQFNLLISPHIELNISVLNGWNDGRALASWTQTQLMSETNSQQQCTVYIGILWVFHETQFVFHLRTILLVAWLNIFLLQLPCEILNIGILWLSSDDADGLWTTGVSDFLTSTRRSRLRASWLFSGRFSVGTILSEISKYSSVNAHFNEQIIEYSWTKMCLAYAKLIVEWTRNKQKTTTVQLTSWDTIGLKMPLADKNSVLLYPRLHVWRHFSCPHRKIRLD